MDANPANKRNRFRTGKSKSSGKTLIRDEADDDDNDSGDNEDGDDSLD